MPFGRYSKNKDIEQFVRQKVKEGWTVAAGTKHRRLYTPDGRGMKIIPGSPSDHRAVQNFIAQINRIERDPDAQSTNANQLPPAPRRDV